jgi:hypothetical protein
VVYFPALNAFQSRASSRTYLAADYVVKSGRALVLPVYKGSFERWDNALDATGEQYLRAARQRLLHWRQDLGRTMDYLDARGDIKMDRVAFTAEASARRCRCRCSPRDAVSHRDLLQQRLHHRTMPPEMDAANYVSRVKIPLLVSPAATTTSSRAIRRSARCSSCSAAAEKTACRLRCRRPAAQPGRFAKSSRGWTVHGAGVVARKSPILPELLEAV